MPGALVRIKDGLKHRTEKGILAGGVLYAASEDELCSFGDKFDLVPVTPSFVSEQSAGDLCTWLAMGVLDPIETRMAEEGGKNRKTVVSASQALTKEQETE